MLDLVDQIIGFESGDLGANEVLALFSNLKKSGMLGQLQGVYGRTFAQLVEAGALDEDGNILLDT